jgi:hypothetical protein
LAGILIHAALGLLARRILGAWHESAIPEPR